MCVPWEGIFSSCFNVLNGVKQGGIVNPLLFCIHLDNLLHRLCSSGNGRFVGEYLVGALAYANDLMLMAPTPSAMRRLLMIYDEFAREYCVEFNAQESKFFVTVPHST
jgi:hypothetical protein